MSGDTATPPTSILRVFRAAWATPDHYEWFSEYLDAQGLRALSRYVVAGSAILLSTIPAIMLLSPYGAATTPARIAVGLTTLGGLLLAVRWLSPRWPSARESIWFIALADLLITVGCAMDSVAFVGLAGTTVFTAIGGYAALVHGVRVLVAHLIWTTGVIGGLVVVTAISGAPALAIAKGLVVIIANVVIPVVSQLIFELLGADSVVATSDPLTGLVNRRGLERALPGLVTTAPSDPDEAVAVVVIDLDRFKKVNDSFGHDVGDRVLVEAARGLRSATCPKALTCRRGGDEFVVVSRLPVRAVAELAENVRAAVVTTDDELTVSASVGVAWQQTAAVTSSDNQQTTIEDLIRSADRAMYAAKRAGGDRVWFHDSTNADPESADRHAV